MANDSCQFSGKLLTCSNLSYLNVIGNLAALGVAIAPWCKYYPVGDSGCVAGNAPSLNGVASL